MKRFIYLTSMLMIVVCAGVTMIRASSSGADQGYSGGPVGYISAAGNCTACHEFNPGLGGVELIGAPTRYRPGASYDMTVRVFDVDQQSGGFQISAEGNDAEGNDVHVGDFSIIDTLQTKNASTFDPISYVTHTKDGYNNALSQWVSNGHTYSYSVRWNAPAMDEGPVTFFVAGNAVNGATVFFGDRYYATHATLPTAIDGDGDGDTDIDLMDFAMLQRCLDDAFPWVDPVCVEVDFDSDRVVTLLDLLNYHSAQTGPVATIPAEFVLADSVRGGRLYDKWWLINGAPAPVGEHPLYPDTSLQSGSSTFRCKECHGWDYKGVDGAYGSGTHFTGIGGVAATALGPQELFDLLKSNDTDGGGHNMDAAGMTDRDLWDVVKMTLEGTLDTDMYIDGDDQFISVQSGFGQTLYNVVCSTCHGGDGTDLNFGTVLDPVYLGTVANANPWEFLHTVRFGHPGTPMPALELLRWTPQRATEIGAYVQTLPQ